MFKLLNNSWFLVGFTIVCLVSLISLRLGGQDTSSSQETIAALEQETQQLTQEILNLESELGSAQTSFAQEKVIRDELLLQKPGEQVVQIAFTPPEPVVEAEAEAPTPWEEWKRLLF